MRRQSLGDQRYMGFFSGVPHQIKKALLPIISTFNLVCEFIKVRKTHMKNSLLTPN